jgi:hypothetical protein
MDKIIKGANPADIPVEVNPKIEFIINLKVAKALGSRPRRRCCIEPIGLSAESIVVTTSVASIARQATKVATTSQ